MKQLGKIEPQPPQGIKYMLPDDALIAQQAREIAELKEQVTAYKDAADRIHLMLICIGGPLNDNKLGYTREQLKLFYDIERLTGD
jgi:hypothetical protein